MEEIEIKELLQIFAQADNLDRLKDEELRYEMEKTFSEQHITWFLRQLHQYEKQQHGVIEWETALYHRFYFFINDDKHVVYMRKNKFTRKCSFGIMSWIKWRVVNLL